MSTKRIKGAQTAGTLLSRLTGKNVIGGQVDYDVARFDFDGNVAGVNTQEITAHTGYPTEARGWSIFVWRPGKERCE